MKIGSFQNVVCIESGDPLRPDDQVVYLFNIWSLTTMEICPVA